MTRINILCLAALAASSLTAANASDLENFRRDIERQFGADFVRDAPLPPNASIAIAPDCSLCTQQIQRESSARDQSDLRLQYESDQRSQVNHKTMPVPPVQSLPDDIHTPSSADGYSASAQPQGSDARRQQSRQGVGRDLYGTYTMPEPSTPPPSRSGVYIPPYDTTPTTPQLQHASPTLSLLPNVGTKQSTGRQVWAVIDGDDEFAQADSSPYAPTTHHHGIPVSVRVSPMAAQAGQRGGAQGREGYMGDLPLGIVQPSIYPPIDAFGNPSLDLRLAASIPANAITASNIDPDRLMQTPVAYHTEGASLAEILRSLVPATYKVSYDIDPGIRDKVYRVTIEKPLAEAIQAVEAMANVHIKPYHKLQVLLVTEHRDALK